MFLKKKQKREPIGNRTQDFLMVGQMLKLAELSLNTTVYTIKQ